MVGDVPSIRSFWEIFSKFSNFLRSLVLIQSTAREASHSPFGYNNLVTIHFWWRETVLKHEKVYKNFVHECLKIFILIFTSFKVHGNSKSDQCCAAEFFPIFKRNCLNLTFGWLAVGLLSIPSFSWIFLIFPDILRSQAVGD